MPSKTLMITAALLVGLASGSMAEEVPYGHAAFHPTKQRPVGWRINGNGSYPGATPVTQWEGADARVDDKTTNIIWKSALPNWSNSNCIVVGDKVITLVNPHTIMACDAKTGKMLWHNATDMLDTQMPAEDAAQMRALYTKWVRMADLSRKIYKKVKKGETRPPAPQDVRDAFEALGKEMTAAGISWKHGELAYSNSHFGKHGFNRYGYGCLGNCSSTPLSDGRNVYAVYGSNTVACYDVADGRCKWIKWLGPSKSGNTWGPVENPEIKLKNDLHHQFYGSPLLLDDVLVIQAGTFLRGLEADTGKVIWEHYHGMATADTPTAMRVPGPKTTTTPVVVTCQGWIVRASDGQVFELPVRQHTNCHFAPLSNGRDLVVMAGAISIKGSAHAKGGEIHTYRLQADADGVITNTLVRNLGKGGSQVTALLDGENLWYGGEVRSIVTGESLFRYRLKHSGYNGPVRGGQYVFASKNHGVCSVAKVDGSEVRTTATLGLPDWDWRRKRGTKADPALVQAFHDRREHALVDGVIGWLDQLPGHGGGIWSQYGQLPFFQGSRIFLRTRQHLWCIGDPEAEWEAAKAN